jgi:hypothetical protein
LKDLIYNEHREFTTNKKEKKKRKKINKPRENRVKALPEGRYKKFQKSVDKTRELGYISKCAVERDTRHRRTEPRQINILKALLLTP